MRPGRILAIVLLAFSGAAAAQPVRVPYVSAETIARDRWVVSMPRVDLPPGLSPLGEMRSVEMRYAPVSGGKITQCEVTRSSGVEALDAESCRILLERGFAPPVHWQTSGRMRFEWLGRGDPWARRGGPLPLDFDNGESVNGQPINLSSGFYEAVAVAAATGQGPARFRITVSDQGRALGCRVTSGRPGARRYARYRCGGMQDFIPASDGAGGTRRSYYRGTTQVRRRPGAL